MMMMRFLLIKNLFKTLSGTYLLSILMLIQGCNTNNIGQELSNSFDQPAMQSNLNTKSRDSEEEKPLKDINNLRSNDLNDKGKKSIKLTNKRKLLGLKKINFTPRPYRITIKLSGANPSSPSQSVTNALIKAGVKFEVEKIERIQEGEVFNSSSNRGKRR